MRLILTSIVVAALVAPPVFAQDLPKEITGRWSWSARNVSQTFSLEDIQVKDGATFAARLTWWTVNGKCAIRGEAVQGQVSPTGLAFEATTQCNDVFAVELNRADGGWKGTGKSKGPSAVVVEISAK